MSEEHLLQPPAPGTDLPFREALRRRWRTAPVTSTTRMMGAVAAPLIFIGIHLAVFLAADNRWSLAVLPLLPVASGLMLWGWTYQRAGSLALGIALGLLACGGPFYLTA